MNRNKIQFLALLILGLLSCNDHNSKDNFIDKANQPNTENVDTYYNTINLKVNNPTVIDSSEWILYPLTLEEVEETEKGFKSISYGRQNAFWNIVFFNSETKQTQLLSDSLKMLINSIHTSNNNAVNSANRAEIIKKTIFYSITVKDFNQDGELNGEDPKYLYVSDLSGKEFKQISPDNFDLIHWQTAAANKILIQTHNDLNKNKKFDIDDEIVSFIYDLDNKKLEPIFSNEFILKTKKIFKNHWLKKK